MQEQLWCLQLHELLNMHAHPCLPCRNTCRVFSTLQKSSVLYSINTAWKLSQIVCCVLGEGEGFCGTMLIQFQICHQWLLTPMATCQGRKTSNLGAKRPGSYAQMIGSHTLQPLANFLTFRNLQNQELENKHKVTKRQTYLRSSPRKACLVLLHGVMCKTLYTSL